MPYYPFINQFREPAGFWMHAAGFRWHESTSTVRRLRQYMEGVGHA